MNGRDYVIPADVKYIYPATVTHRLLLTPEAKAAGKTAEGIVEEILAAVTAPVLR